MKYDLGGTFDHDDYISVNLAGNPHVKLNILDLDSLCEDNTVDEFYMRHTYEHLDPSAVPEFLKKIQLKLKENGTLRILHTDCKKVLKLYKSNKIDFKSLRDVIFGSVDRRIVAQLDAGFDILGHKYMWGEDELKEELTFYGFSKAETYDAGFWSFDTSNYFPTDNMEKYHGLKIPNLGVIAYK